MGQQLKISDIYGPQAIEQLHNEAYSTSKEADMSIETYAKHNTPEAQEISYDIRVDSILEAMGFECDPRNIDGEAGTQRGCLHCNRTCLYSTRIKYQMIGDKFYEFGLSTVDMYLPCGSLKGEIEFDDTKDHRNKNTTEPKYYAYCANFIENKSTEFEKAEYKARVQVIQRNVDKFGVWFDKYKDLHNTKDILTRVRIALEAVHIVVPYDTVRQGDRYVHNSLLTPSVKMLMVDSMLNMVIDAGLCDEMMEILLVHKPGFMSFGQSMLWSLRTNKKYKVNGVDPITTYKESKKEGTISMSKLEKTNKDGKTYTDESKFQSVELGWDRPDWRSDEDLSMASMSDWYNDSLNAQLN